MFFGNVLLSAMVTIMLLKKFYFACLCIAFIDVVEEYRNQGVEDPANDWRKKMQDGQLR